MRTTGSTRRSASSTRAAATILARRWLTDDKSTLHELAAEYGVSAERIRQIEANAIAKLRARWSLPKRRVRRRQENEGAPCKRRALRFSAVDG